MSLKGSDIAKQLALVDEQERKLAITRALTLEKAYKSGDVDAIYKAQNYYQNLNLRQAPKADGMKSIVLDPMELASSQGYYSKATSLSYGMLRAMAKTPVISAIIRTRCNQVAEFTKPQVDKYSKGFVIVKDGVDDPDDLSDRDKRVIDKITKFILACGETDREWDMDDFEAFIRKIVVDSLTLDQATFEIIPTRAFEPYQFVAVDAATFRLADTYDNDNNTNGKKKIRGYYPSYVQLYNGTIVSDFYPWELCFGIRNPSTNIMANGYGRSELEDLVTTVTAMLNADKYNSATFTRGSSPKGMLLVKKGGINKDKIAEVKRDWNAMVQGADNNSKTLIMDGESFEWVDLQKTNKDMEYSQFQEYLVKLACGVYTISPEEIGFPIKGMNSGGMGSQEGGKQEKDFSLSKGLKPLLTFIESIVNKFVVGPKTNKTFKFKFVGLEVESAKDEEERLLKAATVYMTPDEIRKGKKMKPLPNGMGQLPLNPIISQMTMMNAQNQQDQMQQQNEQDQQQSQNENPFLDEGDGSPFKKSYNDFIETNFITVN